MEEESLVKSMPLGKTKQGEEVKVYRIYNHSNSYVEFLDLDLRIRGLNVHKRDRSLMNVICSFETLEEYENSDNGMIVIESDKDIKLEKHVWDVEEIGDNFVIFTNKDKKLDVNITCKISFMDLDRIVLDYNVKSENDLMINVYHNITLTLGVEWFNDVLFRAFTKESIVNGQIITTEALGYSGFDYKKLEEGKEFSLIESQDMIHPFSEYFSDRDLGGTDATVSVYTTMDENFVKVTKDGIKSILKYKDMINVRKDKPFVNRIVYGYDIKYREEYGSFNPFTLFLR